MRKIFRLAVVAVLIIGLFLFVGCNDNSSGDKVVLVELISGTVKELYDLDEEFGYGDAMLNVVYESGKEIFVVITSEMLEGFDTSTTGKKTLAVTYEGKSVNWDYEVVYSLFPAKKILTDARLTIYNAPYPTGTGRYISLISGSLRNVRGISFTLKSNVDIIDETFNTFEADSDWTVMKYYVNAKTMKILLYKERGMQGDISAVTVNFAGVQNAVISLTEITVSDGTTDFSLPDVVGV